MSLYELSKVRRIDLVLYLMEWNVRHWRCCAAIMRYDGFRW